MNFGSGNRAWRRHGARERNTGFRSMCGQESEGSLRHRKWPPLMQGGFVLCGSFLMHASFKEHAVWPTLSLI